MFLKILAILLLSSFSFQNSMDSNDRNFSAKKEFVRAINQVEKELKVQTLKFTCGISCFFGCECDSSKIKQYCEIRHQTQAKISCFARNMSDDQIVRDFDKETKKFLGVRNMALQELTSREHYNYCTILLAFAERTMKSKISIMEMSKIQQELRIDAIQTENEEFKATTRQLKQIVERLY